jgi:hypothetical protein
MNIKYSQRTPLGCLENGVTKDEAREECWFQLPATNAGVLAEAARVVNVSVRKGSDCVSRWHFDQEYGWLSRSGEPSPLRNERNDNEQEN